MRKRKLRVSYHFVNTYIGAEVKTVSTQMPDLEEESEDINREGVLSIAETQLNLLIRALKMIQAEGVLNRYMFDESDLNRLKEEIKELLQISHETTKLSSIWMNYTGASSLGGPTKTSATLNIGKKHPVLHYVQKEQSPVGIPSLVQTIIETPSKRKSKRRDVPRKSMYR